MNLLVVSNIYPTLRNKFSGTYVADQVESIQQEISVKVVAKLDRSWFTFPSFFLRSAWYSLSARYDVIHAHYGFHSALIPSFFGRVPLVVTFHGSDALFEPYRNLLYSLFNKITLLRASRVIAVSEQIAKVLQNEFRVQPDKITVVPCGVNTENFTPRDKLQVRRKLGLAPEGKIVLFIGRFTVEKGVDLIKESASRLPDIQFLFIGQGHIKWEASNCRFLGVIEHSHLPEWVSAADALLLPSQSEGTPVVVLEALASEVPVICTPVGSCPQLIEEGKTGFLVPVGDIEGLTSAIKKRFTWTHFTPDTGRTLVLEKYSLQVVAKRLLDVYRRVVNDRR